MLGRPWAVPWGDTLVAAPFTRVWAVLGGGGGGGGGGGAGKVVGAGAGPKLPGMAAEMGTGSVGTEAA